MLAQSIGISPRDFLTKRPSLPCLALSAALDLRHVLACVRKAICAAGLKDGRPAVWPIAESTEAISLSPAAGAASLRGAPEGGAIPPAISTGENTERRPPSTRAPAAPLLVLHPMKFEENGCLLALLLLLLIPDRVIR
jgi:hypothetical protein